MAHRWLIGVDVGGTKIEAMALDGERGVQGYGRVGTPQGSPQDLIQGIQTAIAQALEAAGGWPEEIQAIGVGIPGQVQEGVVRLAVNLGLKDFPMAEALRAIWNRPVQVENDVRVAARGAYRLLSSQRAFRRLVYLSIGTGVAAAALLDGEPEVGADHLAGEIGHVVVEPDGPLCACGGRGCLEALVSGPALVQQALEVIRMHSGTRLTQMHPLDAPAIYRAAREGDETARRLIDRTARYLALAIQWLGLTWDPEVLVIGGGLTAEGEAFLEPLRRALVHQRGASRVGGELFHSPDRIQLMPPSTRVALWGAVELAKRLAG